MQHKPILEYNRDKIVPLSSACTEEVSSPVHVKPASVDAMEMNGGGSVLRLLLNDEITLLYVK